MATGKKAEPAALSKAVAAILRAQIAYKQIVQAEAAKAAGLSQAQLSGVLNAKKHIDVEKLDELCWVLGLELRDVIAEADVASSDRQLSPTWTAQTIVRN